MPFPVATPLRERQTLVFAGVVDTAGREGADQLLHQGGEIGLCAGRFIRVIGDVLEGIPVAKSSELNHRN
jgi:hypothetical protein